MVITSKQQQNNIKLFIVPEAKTDAFDELVETLYDAGLPVFPAAYDADLDQLKPLTRVKDCRAYRPGRRLWESAECIAVRLDDLVLIDDDGYKDIPDERRLERRRVLRELTDGANPVQANDAKRSYHYLARIDDHEGLKHSADGYMGLKIDIKTGNQLMYIKPGKSLDLRALRRHKRLPEASEATIAALKSKRKQVNGAGGDISDFTRADADRIAAMLKYHTEQGRFYGTPEARFEWLRVVGCLVNFVGTEWDSWALEMAELVDDGNGDTFEKLNYEKATPWRNILGMELDMPTGCTDDDLADDVEEDFAYAPQYTKKDWLIKGFSNFASTFELVGESNIGKSFELLARMACVATGTDYMGWQTRRAHCFYYDAEGGAETETRIDALRQAFNDPLEWLHVVDIQKNGWDITNKADRKKMLEFMIAESKGAPIGLVAFDSLNQTMVNYKAGNFDENNSTDMGKVASALKDIAEITGACAGVVHHPAKSKSGAALRTGRGSGALHGAVDFVHVLEEAGQGQLNMYTEKARGAERKSPFGIKLVKITLDGVEPEQEPERKPFDASAWGLKQHDDPQKHESNVTLFAVPVRQLPFESAAGKAGRKAVRDSYAESRGLRGNELRLVNALEELQNAEYKPRGYSASEIITKVGTNNGTMYSDLKALATRKRGVIALGRDEKGHTLKNQYLIPYGPNDLDIIESDDLSDD